MTQTYFFTEINSKEWYDAFQRLLPQLPCDQHSRQVLQQKDLQNLKRTLLNKKLFTLRKRSMS